MNTFIFIVAYLVLGHIAGKLVSRTIKEAMTDEMNKVADHSKVEYTIEDANEDMNKAASMWSTAEGWLIEIVCDTLWPIITPLALFGARIMAKNYAERNRN